MVNPESALQLQRLLEMLKRKALETSGEGGQRASNEIFSRSVVRGIANPEVSSRLQRLLELLTNKTVDGSIIWDEHLFDQLFVVSVAKLTFAVERGHRNVMDLFAFEIYDSSGALAVRITSSDEQYPEIIRENIKTLWNIVGARSSHLVSLLDQALDAVEKGSPSSRCT